MNAIDAERWRALVENPWDHIAVVGEDLRYRYVNHAASVERREELVGKASPLDLIPESDIPHVRATIERAIRERCALRYEVHAPMYDRCFSTIVLGFVTGDRRPAALLITRDLSALKRAEAELGRHRDNLDELVRARTAALEEANARLAELARTDPLTGLLNRGEILRLLDLEVARIERYGGVLSILMIDLDHFKRINDTRGHLVGDRALEAVGVVLKRELRAVDARGRYGGEEFLILMPETNPNGSRIVAERLRAAVAGVTIRDGQGTFSITCSVGAATWSKGQDSRTLLRIADTALLEAKREGRNRVVIAAPPAPEPEKEP